MTLKIGSLFSGYGGLDQAVCQVLDAETAWFCEYDDAPAKILHHHYPDVLNHRDVTTVDWSQVDPVDILTGGYPCQPFSAAGKRKGTNDERHLWPHVRDAIRVLRPQLVFLENVAGHLTLGFDTVLADLAQIGFDAEWTTLRASDVGAPHHRDRLFILATPANAGGIGLEAERLPSRPAQEVPGDHDSHISLAGIGGATDFEREIRCRWGDAAGSVMAWAVLHGYPPPIIVDQVAGYVDEELFGTRFPEIKPAVNPEFVEWTMGLPAGWVTGVPGLSRADQLKSLGNGVVPDQAAAALREMLARSQYAEVAA